MSVFLVPQLHNCLYTSQFSEIVQSFITHENDNHKMLISRATPTSRPTQYLIHSTSILILVNLVNLINFFKSFFYRHCQSRSSRWARWSRIRHIYRSQFTVAKITDRNFLGQMNLMQNPTAALTSYRYLFGGED